MATKLEDFFLPGTERLKPAEEALRQRVVLGHVSRAGSVRPDPEGEHGGPKDDDEDPNANVVRASFIRYLALGGCENLVPHQKGVQLMGAWVEGDLDFEACELTSPLWLADCWLHGVITLRDATSQTIGLNGCRLPVRDRDGSCFNADRLRTNGGVFLRDSRQPFHATGEVRLLGAHIRGNFECDGGRFEGGGGDALSADGAEITGDLFMRERRFRFHSTGEVRLIGATIGGDLSCTGGRFDAGVGGDAINADRLRVSGGVFFSAGDNPFHATGAVRLLSAEVGSDLSCVGGRFENPERIAFNAQKLRVKDALRLIEPPVFGGEQVEMFEGLLNLNEAEVDNLVDEESCWPREGMLVLDGFSYRRIVVGPVDAKSRVNRWLKRQYPPHLGAQFKPQPWDQVEKVLKLQGEGTEAKRVAVAREDARRAAGKVPLFTRPFHWLYGRIVGYGYFTVRAVIPAAVLWLLGWLFYAAAWSGGAFAPADAEMLDTAEWRACIENVETNRNPAACWAAATRDDGTPRIGADYEPYYAPFYSLDVMVPFITIGQEDSWLPVPGRGAGWIEALAFEELALIPGGEEARSALASVKTETTIGDVAWVYRFIHEILGYVLSAFVAAGAIRLVREE